MKNSVGGDAEGGMMMEVAPSAAFIVSEAESLLEVLMVALDAPAQFVQICQSVPGRSVGEGGKPVLD